MNQMEPGNNGIDKLVDGIKVRSALPSDEHTAEKSFERLMTRIANDRVSAAFMRRIRRYRIAMAVASVALVFTLGGLLYTYIYKEAPAMLVACNHTGEVQRVTLADGTVIMLNNRSKLTYPEAFDGERREVFLDGEAYFDVAHDKKHPFVVRAGNLDIKVLGTKFTVDAAIYEPHITAMLIEGSIDVSDPNQHVLMKPNQKLVYNTKNGAMELAEVEDAEREARWTDNVWVLTNTPLLEVCHQLEHQFNVKFIIVNEELIGKSFTGEFGVDESLESVLRTLQITTPFSYQRKCNNIIIK